MAITRIGLAGFFAAYVGFTAKDASDIQEPEEFFIPASSDRWFVV